MAEFGRLNLNTSFSPTGSFPIDARMYFDTMEEAMTAIENAVAVGELGTYYHGMQILVKDGNDDGEQYVWYRIKTDGQHNSLAKLADRDVHTPIIAYNETEMNNYLASATIYNIGNIYKYMGDSGLYERGAYYVLTTKILDGDNVRYQ